MKLFAAILLLVAPSAPVWAQSDSDRVPASRPKLTAAMLRQSPSARTTELASDEVSATAPGQVASNGILVMAPFAVTTSALPPSVARDRLVSPAPMEHPFDGQNGGTIYQHDGKVFSVKLEFDYDYEFNVIKLLKISW